MGKKGSNAIYVRVSDGLGNQMFQYAAGRALSARNDVSLVIEPVPEFFSWGGSSRRFGLSHFNLSSRVTINYPGFLLRFGGKKPQQNLELPTLKEGNAYQFEKEIKEAKSPLRMEGFFQSADYFSDLPREVLLQDFSLKKGLSRKGSELREKIGSNSNSICIHMRLADYKNSGIFNSLNENYYQSALEKIRGQLTGEPAIWVFSNGSKEEVGELCKRSGILKAEIQTDQKLPEWELIHVMSAFQHHVIANSTFSWWAAWLKGAKGVTVMPKQWFRESSWEAKGLQLSGWSQV
jgi:hypothetical protein